MTVTRFAPSPTGWLHVGNLRTALFNWAIARKAGGAFILRIDDTDRERSREEYVDGIKADLAWLGLTWDRIERQSARLDRYAEAAERLRQAGRLYECFETQTELELKRKRQLSMGRPPVYDRAALALDDAKKAELRAAGRKGYWRFLLEHTRIEWTDGILGPISIDAASVSDPVLIRADGQVLYTFASSVDDLEMGVTHIVRGADHVTNTAVQIQIMRALGGEPPAFSHHSLLVGADGQGLSKRLGALALRELRAEGVEPMALLSLMARLGSSKPVVLFDSLEELLADFDIASFGAAPTRFDPTELTHLSRQSLRRLSVEEIAPELAALGVPEPLRPPFWAAVRENVSDRKEIAAWWALCRDGAVVKVAPEDAGFAHTALALLPPPPWGPTSWAEWTARVQQATGRKGKALYLPLRRLLTGRDSGPDMAALMPLIQALPRVSETVERPVSMDFSRPGTG